MPCMYSSCPRSRQSSSPGSVQALTLRNSGGVSRPLGRRVSGLLLKLFIFDETRQLQKFRLVRPQGLTSP